ncbi:MAG: hypothetical protein E7667_01170 [Ruminococcaceae bacterium]|nr:hypothetical protein [Oscillospiraceae bacterium]
MFRKYLLFAIVAILIIAAFVGCEQNTEQEKEQDGIDDINPEYSIDAVDLPEIEEITRIDIRSGAHLDISITDNETIREIHQLLLPVQGRKTGGMQGVYGFTYDLNVYTDEGECWDFTILTERAESSAYGYNGSRYVLSDGDFFELVAIIEQAYIDNRTHEAPLECLIPTTSVGIDVKIAEDDCAKILSIFNEAEWIFKTEESIYSQIEKDYIFLLKSGAEIYYQEYNGLMYDRDYNCHFYLSNEDKAIINNILGIEE